MLFDACWVGVLYMGRPNVVMDRVRAIDLGRLNQTLASCDLELALEIDTREGGSIDRYCGRMR